MKIELLDNRRLLPRERDESIYVEKLHTQSEIFYFTINNEQKAKYSQYCIVFFFVVMIRLLFHSIYTTV